MKHIYQKSLQVDHANGHTAGHFEGHPIVPGAVSLKWMLEVLAEALQTPVLESFRIRNFKCLQELPPPCEVTVTVYQKNPETFTLELTSNQGVVATTEVDYPSDS